MKILTRAEAEATNKPLFTNYLDVPAYLYSPTRCKRAGLPVLNEETPSAYVLNRLKHGYMPLYERKAVPHYEGTPEEIVKSSKKNIYKSYNRPQALYTAVYRKRTGYPVKPNEEPEAYYYDEARRIYIPLYRF